MNIEIKFTPEQYHDYRLQNQAGRLLAKTLYDLQLAYLYDGVTTQFTVIIAKNSEHMIYDTHEK